MEKSILEQYAGASEEVKDLRRRINNMEAEIHEMERTVMSDSVNCGRKGKKPLGTVKITGTPYGVLSRKKAALCARQKNMAVLEAQLLDLMNQVEAYIDSIKNPEMRMIFRYYHIDGLTWEEVARQMNHTYRNKSYTGESCRKRHNRYLEKFF